MVCDDATRDNLRPKDEDQDAEADSDGGENPPAVPRPCAVASTMPFVITVPAVRLSGSECAGAELAGTKK